MKRARDRGEYRPLFEALYDGADYQRLPPVARSVLIAVKVKLPGWGIGVLPALAGQAAYWTGFDADACAAALELLEREGWIRREGAVTWLVRGLEFEPTRNVGDPKHRTSLASHLDTLPSVPLLHEFRRQYPDWCPEAAPTESITSADAGEGKGRPSADPAEALTGPSEGSAGTLRTPPPPPEPTPTTPPPPAAGRAVRRPEGERRTASRWPQLHAKLPPTGVHRQQVAEFLATVPAAKADAWCAILLNALAGLDTPGGVAVSADQLVTAIAEYQAKVEGDHSPALFNSCLARVLARRWSGSTSRPRAPGGGGAGTANGAAQTTASANGTGKKLRRLTAPDVEAAS